ncbi:MAG TPA: TonB-dependent receptor [Acetobacteraceae bacterium]|nr:TonB-dependent receptor [Acetobacteraceae bacterium]
MLGIARAGRGTQAGFGFLLAACGAIFPVFVQAQSLIVDAGSVSASGQTASGGALMTSPGSAPYEAPSIAPLNEGQPTSVISAQSIANNFAATSSYSDIVKLSPSVSGTDPDGPGLMESQALSIRGFQDGQFNVMFDGIPISETAPGGDPNDFAHHTTSYFKENDIAQIIVDRGPGTASTIGNATFGGTIAILTKNPLPVAAITPSASLGSFNTAQQGLEYDTGEIGQTGGLGVIDISHLKSDGYLTYAGQERNNIFGKFILPLGSDTVLTFLSLYNHTVQHTSLGQTAAQIEALGSNYGLSNDPTSQAYTGYNTDHVDTDFSYVGLTSRFAPGWRLESKLYTYGYDYNGHNGLDPNGNSPNGTTTLAADGTYVDHPNNVPGQNLRNAYRSIGLITRFERRFSAGDVKFGVWLDHQRNRRTLTEIDLTQGGVYNFAPNGVGTSPVDILLRNETNTLQPYIQLDLKPIPGLTLTPGVKYAYFERNLSEPINNEIGQAVGYIHEYHALLPSFEARYHFNPAWSAYAQVAEGYLGPNRDVLYTTSGADPDLTPETTWNYQIGMARQTQNLALDADAYLVHFNNLISAHSAGPTTIFYNQGGVVYRGIEGEATYNIGAGASIFANGSLNDANTTAHHTPLAETPQFTANGGVIYNKNGLYAALIDQWTGGHYDNNALAPGNVPGQWYAPYNLLNFALAYDLPMPGRNRQLPPIKFKIDIENLTNQTQIFDSVGTAVDGVTPLYFTLPGRSVFVSLSVPFG